MSTDELQLYQLFGRFVGKCLASGDVTGLDLSRAVCQRLLGRMPALRDLKSFDVDLHSRIVRVCLLHCRVDA